MKSLVFGIALPLSFACICLAQSGGPIERVPNATMTNLPANPPGYAYSSTNALGTLVFTNPVAIASPPGETNRLFVLEKRGRIVVITNLASPTRTIFMDIDPRVSSTADTDVGGEEGLLGLAFHPGYTTNRFFYVFYTGNDNTGTGTTRHDILSRFTTSDTDPNQGLTNSEVKLIRQRDEAVNHNAGDLHFGADGYLYVSLGDEGAGDDTFLNSQKITNDFFSAMLRIDVDIRPGGLNPNPHAGVVAPTNYAVPPDNPFVHTSLDGTWNGLFNGISMTNNLGRVRTEFWAVGLRNPWRWSFDLVTGYLYCGDVGQNAREELDIITKGGNYGWVFREGIQANPNTGGRVAPAGFTYINPILDYSHSEGITIIGGVVYRGQRISPLYGAYIFADYGSSGQIWMTRYNGTNATAKQLLLTDSAISAFGVDPRNGDILYTDLNGGTNSTVDRINPGAVTGTPYPTNLSATGAFADLATLTPQAGIVPYDVNVPFWSDNAIKSRWFSLPNTNLTIGFNRDGNWTFPNGSVWIKHFELELTNGIRKRLETRFIVKHASGVYGMTYRWGDSTTNATLVPEQGMDESFVVDDGGGILRTQVWHYPSRTECLQCHTPAGGFALGFNSAQMNRHLDYGGTVTNQIAALSLAGYFNTNVTGIHTLRALAHPTNEAASQEYRVRSYLAANCAQCHQPGGTAQGALWDARIATPTALAGLINGALQNNGGDTNNRVVVPGSLEHSMLLTRISTLGPGRMPPLDSNLLDTNAISLLSAWITNDLPSYQSFADWQIANFGSTNAPNSGANEDADSDGASNYLEYLTRTDPAQATNVWTIGVQLNSSLVEILFPQIANRGFEVQSTSTLFPASWSPLDVPQNAPFFSITNRNAQVPDTISSETNKFYRVRIFEP